MFLGQSTTTKCNYKWTKTQCSLIQNDYPVAFFFSPEMSYFLSIDSYISCFVFPLPPMCLVIMSRHSLNKKQKMAKINVPGMQYSGGILALNVSIVSFMFVFQLMNPVINKAFWQPFARWSHDRRCIYVQRFAEDPRSLMLIHQYLTCV